MTSVPGSSVQMPTFPSFGKGLILIPLSKSSVAFNNLKQLFGHVSDGDEMRTGQVLLEGSRFAVNSLEDRHIGIQAVPLQPAIPPGLTLPGWRSHILCPQQCWSHMETLESLDSKTCPSLLLHSGAEALALQETRKLLSSNLIHLCSLCP